jgi:adenine-specific DNA glycosylase
MTNEQSIKAMKTKDLAAFLCELADDCGRCPFAEFCNTEHNGAFVWLGFEKEKEEKRW